MAVFQSYIFNLSRRSSQPLALHLFQTVCMICAFRDAECMTFASFDTIDFVPHSLGSNESLYKDHTSI